MPIIKMKFIVPKPNNNQIFPPQKNEITHGNNSKE